MGWLMSVCECNESPESFEYHILRLKEAANILFFDYLAPFHGRDCVMQGWEAGRLCHS